MRYTKKIIVQIVTFSMILSAINVAGVAGSPSVRPAGTAATLTIAEDDFALPEAKVGVSYEYRFQTEGGLAPLNWSVVQGELPLGVKLDATGKLSGTPIQARREAYRFDVRVSDSSQPPQKFSQTFSLTVKATTLLMVMN